MRRIVVQVQSRGGEVVLRKQGPDGREPELALDADEAAQLLGDRHPAVLDARAFTREARVRELAQLPSAEEFLLTTRGSARADGHLTARGQLCPLALDTRQKPRETPGFSASPGGPEPLQ
jgi:hypothetical protein